jgi:GTP pyrophosphokinase
MENLNDQERIESQLVDEAFQRLLKTYLDSNHRRKVEIITKAFNFARQAHKGIRRLSGEPYILHPIAVAQIACEEIGLGSTSICAALLHDVVEDTDYTVEDIENLFGERVAKIVDGVTKISGGIFGDRASVQAESFKKLLLTMSEDIRVILIKISDRLHNMRTLDSQPPNKQYKIAGETLYIYAPIANRLGLNKIKEELEDLSFHYEHPEEYSKITKLLESTRQERDSVFEKFTEPIRKELDKMNLKNYIIKARVKSPYSIWNKMQTKHVSFEEIYDILAVRIIFEPSDSKEEINDCFRIYATISQIYKPHPERFRDWLNHPKVNGYQALHVTLMSNSGRWIEVQIRSQKMDDFAESGFAAHWKYKDHQDNVSEGESESSIEEKKENELNKWLLTIKEILDDPQPDAMDFLDTIKLNLFASEIFVFTPKGEIKTMPADCTVLDFAFSVHTFIGSHCIGAKVNHKLVAINHKLESGDQVEILTSKSQHVQREWLEFVTTAKAKGKIQAAIRREQRDILKQGEDMLNTFLAEHELEANSVTLNRVCRAYNFDNKEALCLALGEKKITLSLEKLEEKKNSMRRSWKNFIPFIRSKNAETEKTVTDPNNPTESSPISDFINSIDRKKPVVLDEMNIRKFVIADCCHPIPGDESLGYIDQNRIVLHTRSCPVAKKLESAYGNRILAVKWGDISTTSFVVNLHIRGIDHIGVLNQITAILSQDLNINIKKLIIETHDGLFDGEVILNVHSIKDVKAIRAKLIKIEEIEEVTRIG